VFQQCSSWLILPEVNYGVEVYFALFGVLVRRKREPGVIIQLIVLSHLGRSCQLAVHA
jgi:hypothetical protein